MSADPAREAASWPPVPVGWMRLFTRRGGRPSGVEETPAGGVGSPADKTAQPNRAEPDATVTEWATQANKTAQPNQAEPDTTFTDRATPADKTAQPNQAEADTTVTDRATPANGPATAGSSVPDVGAPSGDGRAGATVADEAADAGPSEGAGNPRSAARETVGPVGAPPFPADVVHPPYARPSPSAMEAPSAERVPVRTILAAIGVVLAAAAGIELVLALQRVIGMIVIAGFLAVVLSPAVSALVRIGIRRGLATFVVFFVGFAAFGGLGYLFIHPLYSEAVKLSNNLPDILAKTQAGKGPLGKIIAKYHLQKTVSQQIPSVRHTLSHLGGPATSLAKKLVAGLGGLITILVLTFLMLLEGPALVRSTVTNLAPRQAKRIKRILADVSKSVTGYVVGNVATSIIAGIVCMITLLILRVPFAVVFGVWVALVDLLPLVGGLLAGVPTVAFAFLHDPTAGIVTLVVFLVYQQIENHVLNPVIMSRTVKLNPLWVILSVLAGAEMASIIGALLAIPAAGAIQVIARDLWDERRGEPKDPPTTGAEETPIT